MTPVLSSVASAPISRRTALVGGLVSATSLALAACGSNGGIDVKNGVATIAIGATPQPHATILRWVQDNQTVYPHMMDCDYRLISGRG